MTQSTSSETLRVGPRESLAGYHGAYLRVDVSSGEAERIEIPELILRRYLGGAGLGVWLALIHDAPSVDPLSPAAPLAFVFSPLVGSPLTTSAKFAVVSRSPLTGMLNDALSSSAFALAGKKCGVDAIVIQGKAERPAVLVIDDGQVRLESADDVWGRECSPTQEQLRQRFPGDWQFALIGPAGEQQVRYATLSHDGRHAGRGGAGAVLGAKNIKAVVVRGTQRCPWADSAGLVEYARSLSEKSLGPATAKYRELGTVANLVLFNRLQALPTRNFQQGSFAHAEQLSPESLADSRDKTRASCAACTIGCEHIYRIRGPGASDGGSVRMEYENLFALGPLCDIRDPDAVLAASRRCDELGLDTISAGGTIALAMECVERGWLDAPWLRFGDSNALLHALGEIAGRVGIGDRLAEGSRRFAREIGPAAYAIAPQVKGLEIPGYEPRALQTMALGLAVSTRGADHNRSGAYEVDFSNQVDRRRLTPESAVLAVETEDKAALLDSLILCKFLRSVFPDLAVESARMLQLTTGWSVDEVELRATARRIINAKKWFNMQAGWRPEDDTLPDRFLNQALADDPLARLTREQLQAAVREYNLQRGWQADGRLTDDLIRSLTQDLQEGRVERT
ncbi:MAG: aldehyde ferredoxin oxidoreductase C-terminal domain-containing protein [Pirellulales bacterium]